MISRFFTTSYPYLEKKKSYHKLINSFPISFSSEKTHRVSDENLSKNKPEFQGIQKAYEVLLRSLASNKLKDLESLLEYNMIYRMQRALDDLINAGYSLHLRGSIDSFSASIISTCSYIGPLLPHRNLNFPSEYYEIKDINSNLVDYLKLYHFKEMKSTGKNITQFLDMDLNSINQSDRVFEYKDRMSHLISALNKYPLKCENLDLGISTNFKIFVKNSEGQVVAGKDDDEEEFHSVRIEKFKFLSRSSFFTKYLSYQRRAFFSKMLKQYEDYSLVDVDGFMNKNEIIPTI